MDNRTEMHLDQAALHIRMARDGEDAIEHVTPWEYRIPTADELKQMREFCGLSRTEVSEAIDYAPATVANYENKDQPPGREYIMKVLALYKREWPR